jgi:hypothetical protein
LRAASADGASSDGRASQTLGLQATSGPSWPYSPRGSRRLCRVRPTRTVGDKVDDSIKQALLSQFSAWLDSVPDERPAEAAPGKEPAPTTDLYSLFVEMAGLRAEVRTESRLVQEAMEQFRGVFETLQASHVTVQ